MMVFSTQSKVGHGVWIWGNMLHEHDVAKGILEDIIIIDGRPSEDHGRSQDMINVTTGCKQGTKGAIDICWWNTGIVIDDTDKEKTNLEIMVILETWLNDKWHWVGVLN